MGRWARAVRTSWLAVKRVAAGNRVPRWLGVAGVWMMSWGMMPEAAAMVGTGAGEVPLQWNPNPEPHLAGYRILLGTESGKYTETVDVGNVTAFTLEQLPVNQVLFSVLVAYGTEGQESPPSAEISFMATDPERLGFVVEALPAPDPNDPALKRNTPTISDWQSLPEGGFGFVITAAPGTPLAVYASSDMLNWVRLTTTSNASGRLRATDYDADSTAGRFYQVWPAP